MRATPVDTPAACKRTRLRISRRTDGDLTVAADDHSRLDAHLPGCAACQAWQQQASFLRRTVIAFRLDPPADRARAVLAAVLTQSRRRRRGVLLVRALLTALAVVGFALAAPAFALGSDDGIETHAAHEIGSTEVAICIGLLAAALWPRRARGVLAVVGAAAALLVLTASEDILGGRTTLWHELPHGIAVLGALLVWTLARLVPEFAPPVPIPAAALFEVDASDVLDVVATMTPQAGNQAGPSMPATRQTG